MSDDDVVESGDDDVDVDVQETVDDGKRVVGDIGKYDKEPFKSDPENSDDKDQESKSVHEEEKDKQNGSDKK